MAIHEDPDGHEVAALGRMVPSFAGLRVLEIGCGDGRLTRRYAAGAGSIVAIDPDGGAISALQTSMPEVDARAIDILDLKLPPRSVDVAIFSWSL